MRWTKRKENPRWPAGVPKPSIPTPAKAAPSGPSWIHEIKHDGYRLLVRKDADAVRLFTRSGYDWSERYPVIRITAHMVQATSFTLDGECVVCRPDGVADFSLLHSRQHDARAFLYAFDLLELDGEDLRPRPLHERKERLRNLIGRLKGGIVYSDEADLDGHQIFEAACKMGLEGIVSKRRDRPYTSGPCKHWIKVKNPDAPWKTRLEA